LPLDFESGTLKPKIETANPREQGTEGHAFTFGGVGAWEANNCRPFVSRTQRWQ
jgi:hypothetical protein